MMSWQYHHKPTDSQLKSVPYIYIYYIDLISYRHYIIPQYIHSIPIHPLYPNDIPIISQLHPNHIPITSISYFNYIPILSQLHPSRMSIYFTVFQSNPIYIPIICQFIVAQSYQISITPQSYLKYNRIISQLHPNCMSTYCIPIIS